MRNDTAAQRKSWLKARRAEQQFSRALRKIAKKVDEATKANFKKKKPSVADAMKLKRALENYAELLQPWAKATATRMVADVARRDEKAWYDLSQNMAQSMREELKKTPTGLIARKQIMESASLITSLPLEAAERVEKLAVKYMTQGIRASAFAKDIMNTGEVTKSRAMLIARTETSRAVGILQQARAESVGSEGYIWRTSEDIDVRDEHRRLNGRYFTWGKPPIAGSKGERAHPGCIYNCRCWAEIVLPGDEKPNRNRFKAEAA